MAREQRLLPLSLPSSGDLSTKQYLFVDVNSSGQVVVVSSTGGKAIGVLQNNPNAVGLGADVATLGISKVIASAAITAGAEVSSTNAGQAKTAATTEQILGRAMNTTTGAGEILEVLLDHRSVAAP